MVFSNLVFLFLFLPIVLSCYFIVGPKFRNLVLLSASVFFYAWGEPKYILLMIVSMILNYSFGLLIERSNHSAKRKKTVLILSIFSNIAILGFFKYANFFVDNINILFSLELTLQPIPLPLGISFFTFQAMSYLFDVYRNEVKAQKNFLDLSLYISLFPQLVAGPIIRYNDVAEQIKHRVINNEKFALGIRRFIVGLSKKVLIANPLGEIADNVFSTPSTELTVLTAWIGIIAYTLQIYFDFSGYSDMAIGLGLMFGFKFLENFNYPYISRSISEFWRRWHISLGNWFRQYVYIPLGGNRVSNVNIYRNLLIVWTITGFWHGASWTFMAWGFYYGLIICIERAGLEKLLLKTWRPLQHVYVLLIVMIGWVFFRADNFTYSYQYLLTMFGLTEAVFIDATAIAYFSENWYLFVIGIIFSLPVVDFIKSKNPFHLGTSFNFMKEVTVQFGYIMLFVVVTGYLVNSTYNPFIYFRF